MALGLDGAADAGEVLLAVEELCAGHARALAELKRVQEEVLAAREATADVFVEVLEELGFPDDDEVLAAARAAYVANPDAAAMALLGTVDFVQAANPWGCNQYGHRKGHRGGAAAGGKSEKDAREENNKAGRNFEAAQEKDRVARQRVFDLDQEKAVAEKKGDTARAREVDKELAEARSRSKQASEELERARKQYDEAYKRLMKIRREGKKADEDDGGEMPTQEEIDSFDELDLKEWKERMNAFQQEVAKTVRAHTLAKREYNAAYTRVHGRDKSVEVSQADRERLKSAEAKLAAARDAANEALRKRRRATRAAMKYGGQDDEYIERFVGRWPEKVKAANAAECLVSFDELVEAACSVEELLLAEADAVLAANPDGCNQYGHRNGHEGKAIVLKKGSSGGGSGGGRSDGGGKRVLNFLKMGVKDADEPGLIDGLEQVDEQTRRKIRRKAREEYEADPEKFSGAEWKAWRKRYIED